MLLIFIPSFVLFAYRTMHLVLYKAVTYSAVNLITSSNYSNLASITNLAYMYVSGHEINFFGKEPSGS